MNEFDLIRTYLSELSKNVRGAYNLSDDIYYDEKKKLAISIDTYVEKKHFLNFNKPDLIIKKALRSAISDLLCKGFMPKYYLVSLSGNNKHPELKKIAFTGSTEVGRLIRDQTSDSDKKLTLELGGKSPFIVFEDADLDSAIEGLVDAIWFNQGQVCCAGSRLLVQESVAEKVIERLKARMTKLRVGDPLDKSMDIGAIIDPIQKKRIQKLLVN